MIGSILFYIVIRLSASVRIKDFRWPEIALALITISAFLLFVGSVSDFYKTTQHVLIMAVVLLAILAIAQKEIKLSVLDAIPIIVIPISSYLAYRHNLQLHEWDDFSHWGIVQKVLKVTHAISTNVKIDMGASYIQGYSFLIDLLSGSDPTNERALYSASAGFMWTYFFLISFSVFLPSETQTAKNFISVLVATLFFLFLTNQAKDSIYTIYSLSVDFPMALFLTGSVLSLLVKRLEVSFILLVSSCVLLTLSKHTGLFFSGISVLLWIHHSLKQGEARKKTILLAAVAGGSALLIKIIWDSHLIAAGVSKIFNENHFSFEMLAKLVANPREDALLVTIISKMLRTLAGHFLFWFYLIGIFCTTIVLSVKSRKLNLIYLVYSIVSFGCYLGLLILSYRFLFGEYEAAKIASFERYVNTMLIPWGLFSVYWLLLNIKSPFDYLNRFNLISCSAALFVFVGVLGQLKLQIISADRPVPARGELKDWNVKIRPYLEESKKLLFIRQNSNGMECNLMKYEIFPNSMDCEYWSLGKPFSNEDVWTANLTVEQFAVQLERYDFVLVTQDGGTLWSHYGSFFDQHKIGLYKKEIQNNKSVQLKFIL